MVSDRPFPLHRVVAAPLMLLVSCAVMVSGNHHDTAGSSDAKNDITYSTVVPTPHVKWASRIPGGPIRGFLIPSVQHGRDMVELMQRLELAPATVTIDRNWDMNCWGIGDYYGHEFRGDRDDFRIVYGYVEKELTGPEPFEVIVLPGLNGWSRMTRSSRDAILRRVAEGAGLVLIHPFVGDVKGHPFKGDETEGDARLWEISPLVGCLDDTVNERGYPEINRAALAGGRWEIAKEHYITTGQPLELLPEGVRGSAFYKYQAKGDVLIKAGGQPILATKSYGRGRVVAFAYVEEGFIPTGTDPLGGTDEDGSASSGFDPFSSGIYWDYWEYYYSLLARAVVWAAAREGSVQIRSLTAQDSEAAVLRLTLTSPDARKVLVEIAGKSEFGPELGVYRQPKDLAAGETVIEVPATQLKPRFGWPGGKEMFHVIILDPKTGATLNWGAASFDTPKRATLTAVRPTTDVVRRGETIGAAVQAAGNLSGLTMRFKVHDDLERVLKFESVPARGERYFYFDCAHFLGKSAYLTAELVESNGTIVDQLRARPVLVVPDQRRIREFNPLVSFGGAKHFFRAARMQQVRSLAADTGFTWGGSVNNGLNIPRGTFGVYWYDRGPTDPEGMEKAVAEYNRTQDFESLQYLTKKELYRRTGNTLFLTRAPSFLDPAFMRRLESMVYAVTLGKNRYYMDYYFVGDEGSLTSYTDPYDFDWGIHALTAFRRWLRQHYESLDSLNREWKSSYKRWGEILPFTTEQAIKSRNFAPWADHRTFMEVSFASAYQHVREAVLAADPNGHIALSGTQETTAYNGCDWYRLDQIIDDFLSYDGGNQWDMHRSFAKQDATIGFWTGYGSRGIAVQNAIWTAAIHGALHPNIFWMPSFLNPDFTYSQSARDMGEAFKTLKYGGVGKLLMESERLQDGIALHYSMPSVHAASITLNHPEAGRREIIRDFPANRDGWVRAINDLGLQFNFVSSTQVEEGALSRSGYRLLILPFSMAVSPAEVKAIKEFASAGGVVLADAAAGLMDEHCAWQSEGFLNEFFGIAAAPSEGRRLAGSTVQERNQDGDITAQHRTPGIAGPVRVSAEGSGWGLKPESLQDIEAVEESVRATAGQPLVKVGAADAAIVRRAGKGWAVFLNVLLDRYPDLRAKATAARSYRELIKRILEHLNIRPAVQVLASGGAPLDQAQIARYQFGESQVLAIVKENAALEGIAGRDGVTIYSDASLGRMAKEQVSIRLPERAFVHNLITGETLGETDLVNTSVVVGGALVLGMSRSRGSIAVSGPASAHPGEAVRLIMKLSGSGKHLVRCHWFAPDGSLMPWYAQNVLLEGSVGSVVFPSALNDNPGRYRAKLTDVLSGASASLEFTMK